MTKLHVGALLSGWLVIVLCMIISFKFITILNNDDHLFVTLIVVLASYTIQGKYEKLEEPTHLECLLCGHLFVLNSLAHSIIWVNSRMLFSLTTQCFHLKMCKIPNLFKYKYNANTNTIQQSQNVWMSMNLSKPIVPLREPSLKMSLLALLLFQCGFLWPIKF